MRITILGHAGLHIETRHGTILCDPWVNPAFFASWFPFPDNAGLDWDRYGAVDLLYISHLHRDHFDPENLTAHVSRSATVLLPDYPTDELRHELTRLGFTKFTRLANGRPTDHNGLTLMIAALTAPNDGAVGDSALAIDDGDTCILNQNDAKLTDFAPIADFGPYDAHFLQFSGANWWPWAYSLPENALRSFGTAKRSNGLARACRFVETVKAQHVIPSAGPPCFLDDELFQYNDLNADPSNTFPDQDVFLAYLRERGLDGLFTVPGTVLELAGDNCVVTHPGTPTEIRRPFDEKADYLREYALSRRSQIAAERKSWPAPGMTILAELKAWFEPLMAVGEYICAGIGSALLLRVGPEELLIDFIGGQIRRYAGDKYRYSFSIEPALIERLIANREPDWVNSLFLSLRFTATRIGKFNEFIYAFFTCLSFERMAYANNWYATGRDDDGEETELGGWSVPRRCPHRSADLAQLGEIDGDILTCQMHGWRFDLSTGRCLTSPDHELQARRT